MSGRTAPPAAPVTAAPNAPAAPTVPEVLAGVLMPADEVKALKEQLAAANAKLKAAKAAAREARAAEVKTATARDYVRKVDAAILMAVCDLPVWAEVPEALRPEVKKLVANQLHHLTSPAAGWLGELPKPDRSEWR